MTKSSQKRARGRPATGHDPTATIRIPNQALVKIDKMAKDQHTTRAAIIRQIILSALAKLK
jgi:hypothetical protein